MFEIDKKKFGGFLASLRKEKGLTQKDMAQELFISDKAVSKWETGVSIPDTALLVPLADLLGVTVTELLLCERMEKSNVMDAGQVETVVKTAIQYPEENHMRAYQIKGRWAALYGLAFLLGCIGIYLNYLQNVILPTLPTFMVLGAVFGAYFCFFVRRKLPPFYDKNRVNFVSDGIFRMNMPGISFNNKNWPHIIMVGRIWSLITMALVPYVMLLLHMHFPGISQYIDIAVLPFFLASLFLPIYVVGRKYQEK